MGSHPALDLSELFRGKIFVLPARSCLHYSCVYDFCHSQKNWQWYHRLLVNAYILNAYGFKLEMDWAGFK
jgi:hypothetical protein